MYVNGCIDADINAECRERLCKSGALMLIGCWPLWRIRRVPLATSHLQPRRRIQSDEYSAHIHGPVPIRFRQEQAQPSTGSAFRSGWLVDGCSGHYDLNRQKAIKLGGYYCYSRGKKALKHNALLCSTNSRIITPCAMAQTKVVRQTVCLFWTEDCSLLWRKEERMLMQD